MVELITVIVLLSILGVAVMGRMASPDLFAPAIVTHGLVAQTRYAQQLAAARHDATVTLTVDRSGAEWRVRVTTDVDGLVRSELIDADGTSVQAASGGVSAALGPGASMIVTFNHSGDLATVIIDGSAGNPDAGIAITVTGDSTRQACIYTSGYANDDACS